MSNYKWKIYKEKFNGYTIAVNLATGRYVARNGLLTFSAKSEKELKDAIEGYVYM